MKFIVDECLSHTLVRDFQRRGYPDCEHPIHVGLRGVRDDTIIAKALLDDRIIVTSNARDFRRLLGSTPLHAGAIIIHAQESRLAWKLILAALAFIELQTHPADYMINRVVEASVTEGVRPYVLPPVDS